MLDLRFNVPFFDRGQFPTSVSNGSQQILTPNPWSGRGNSAPFDQRACYFRAGRETSSIELLFVSTAFYLILDVAVGGTNGWFPDGAGDKPWLNGAISGYYFSIWGGEMTNCRSTLHLDAMQLFAQSQDKWSKSWPQSEDDRALRMYVCSVRLERVKKRADACPTAIT